MSPSNLVLEIFRDLGRERFDSQRGTGYLMSQDVLRELVKSS